MPALDTTVSMTIGSEVAGKRLMDPLMKALFGDVPEAQALSGLRGALDNAALLMLIQRQPGWSIREVLEHWDANTENTD